MSVQKILNERHPQNHAYSKENLAYPADAYLLAEQYAWIAADPLPLTTLQPLDEVAEYFFVHDLQWFRTSTCQRGR
ncbi:MAG: hypothetical protein WDM76_16805 [Limisphaerales bacterium]